MSLVEIKPASINDIQMIRHIAMCTWPATYYDILSSGQLAYMLSRMYSHATLARQLQTGEQQFLLAIQNGSPIGFAGFGPLDTNGSAITYKLHKLYVLPTIQKSGAGKRLLQEVEKLSKNCGASALLLNVNQSNNAYSFYTHMGFTIRNQVDLDIGNGFFMVDYVMEKRLEL